MPCRQKAGGLTLVELLVAISVLAFVAVLGWRGLDSITRARASLNLELEQARGMQLAFAQLQSDCANVVAASLLDGHKPVEVDAARVTLARAVHADDQPTRLQLVTWRLGDGVLTREESPSTRDLGELDGYWKQAASGGAARPVRLEEGVQGWRLRVWADDGRGWRGWDQAALGGRVSGGSLMNPQAGTTSSGVTAWRGLEVALQMAGRETSLTKVFLLGAV